MQNAESLDDVGEFADVTRPTIGGQGGQRVVGPSDQWPTGAGAMAIGKVSHQGGQVAGPIAQWRQRDRNDIQPKKEVFPKRSFGDGAREVFVGRGQNAHVDRNRFAAPHPLDFAGLDRAQQLGLRVGVQVSHFVQEQCSGVGKFESSNAPIGCAGKGTALVTEHFAFHKVAWNRGAVHAHKGTLAARARQMQRRGDQFFPRP